MGEQSEFERFCGNCHHHSMYKYPDIIFCFKRFEQGKNATFSTLDHCEQWELQLQECFCLRDALEKQSQKRK
ncbi:MAG: hypothetical protein ACE5KC_01055 [Candidatus Bathyarchaeia archaeon]